MSLLVLCQMSWKNGELGKWWCSLCLRQRETISRLHYCFEAECDDDQFSTYVVIFRHIQFPP
jgi:hypothetical protein